MPEKSQPAPLDVIGAEEERLIDRKINFKLTAMLLTMTAVGGIANIIAGIFVLWALYDKVPNISLIPWFIAIVVFNIINVGFSFCYRFSKVTPERIMPWRKVYYFFVLPTVCTTWGVMGILFSSADMQSQVYIITFLLVVLVGFTFGTVTDFISALISISLLSFPYAFFHLYLGINAVVNQGHDYGLNFGFSAIVFLLGVFLLIACLVGYQLIKKSFKLSFVNIALREKLEDANKFLEQRVKERTVELEESLKQAVKLTASIGVSIYPRDGDIKSLLMNADSAMLEAKKRGGNSITIHNSDRAHVGLMQQLEIESYLHSAITNKEFFLNYQPFISVKTGKVCGMEALIRWQHPSLGLIMPGDFVSLAEENGIIISLGEWTLREACTQTKIWHDRGFSELKVAVNLSAKQLFQKNIVNVIKQILQQTQINPHCLELELTETVAFREEVISTLKQFKALGLGLSIDDFGTGYSDLSNLQSLEIDKLKIDKSFVQAITTNNNSKVIVTNTIALAKKMNIAVLAEGVETKEQLAFLKEHGCDMIQGYYFSKPLGVDMFEKFLREQKNSLN